MAQRCSPESSCGAAQPIIADLAAQTHVSELPATAAQLTVGFYNVGIQLTELSGRKWSSKQSLLKADILKAFDTHVLDILCLCELGELGVGIAEGLTDGNVNAWMTELLSDRAIMPVCIFADSHYLTIVRKNCADDSCPQKTIS